MALEDVSFYDIFGNLVSLASLVNDMIERYQKKREAGETKITDFNEGSEIRNLIEIYSVLCFNILELINEVSKLPFIRLSYGTALDMIGENPFINLPRIEGSPSQGEVTFTLGFEQDIDFLIPAETLLEDVNGLEYITDDVCTILAGELTGNVSVTCLTNGYDGNINSGELTVISDDEIVSVINEESFIGGESYEEDEDYRTRLLANAREEGFGSIPYYINLAESINGVHDIKLINDTTYTNKLLVNGYEKPVSDATLLDVLVNFTDIAKKVLNHTFTVDRPTYSTINLTFDLDVLHEWSDEDLTVFVTKLVNGGYFNQIEFEGLNIDENLTHEMISTGFELIDDIVNVSVKQTGQSSEFVSTDIDVNSVVKLGDLVFNQNVISE